jgi:hypothetical protein
MAAVARRHGPGTDLEVTCTVLWALPAARFAGLPAGALDTAVRAPVRLSAARRQLSTTA